jgi:methyl-accepting chemotaxis protein
MDNLADVTIQAAEGTASIASLNQEVKQMAEGIRLATEQQNRAGRQVTEALSEITVAAHQTSAFSEQLWRSAQSLEVLSNNLQQTLAEGPGTPDW